MSWIIFLIVAAAIILPACIKIIREYERAVIFRFGRLLERAKGPGLIFVIPIVDEVRKVDLRIVTMDVPTQDIITRDNVPVKVNAVVYFKVVDPSDSVVKVENYYLATSQFAQTTLRSILGQAELDEILTEREKLNRHIQEILDEHTDPWGIKVTSVEIKDVEIPQGMQRAMARQAEAERERRAKIIAAEGEHQAAEKLAQAAAIIGREPAAIQLRFLQTATEISTEKNSTFVLPLPVDFLGSFFKKLEK